MDKVNGRIAQVYGYAVCLICVVIILVSTNSLVNAAFDYANPLRSDFGRFGPAVTYEGYRMQSRGPARLGPEGRTIADTSVPESEIRKAFTLERNQQLDSARYHALRSLVSSIIFLALATSMFLLHWRWIRRTNAEAAAG